MTDTTTGPGAWVPAFAAPMADPHAKEINFSSRAFADEVLVQRFRLDQGGSALRVTLSNEYGRAPVRVEGHVRGIAGSARPLTASAHAPFTVPPGQRVVTDRLPWAARAGDEIEITLAFRGPTELLTYHPTNLEQSPVYALPSAAIGAPGTGAVLGQQYLVARIDVLSRRPEPVLVAIGDSVTAGYGTTVKGFPGVLRRAGLVVLNMGIAGNRLLVDGVGPALRDRVHRDLVDLEPDGAIVQVGINDLAGLPEGRLTARDGETLAGALLDLVQELIAHGIATMACTLPPVGSCSYPQFRRPGLDVARRAANAALRRAPETVPGARVVDVDRVLNGSRDGTLAPGFDTGDGIHPNDLGGHRIAQAVSQAWDTTVTTASTAGRTPG